MKVTTDTPTVLSVFFPRRLIGDVFAFAFTVFGVVPIISAILSEPGTGRTILFAFGVLFTGLGILIALSHASTIATFDATTQTATIQWRALKGREVKIIPFAEISRIVLHDSDECQTVKIVLTDRSEVILEKGYSGNPEAALMAGHMNAWLHQRNSSAT